MKTQTALKKLRMLRKKIKEHGLTRSSKSFKIYVQCMMTTGDKYERPINFPNHLIVGLEKSIERETT